MYNLKVEAERLMNILNKKGYESAFIGPYPYMKYHNAVHEDRLKTKDIQFVTNASLDQLKNIFKVVAIGSDYVNYCIIETELKQNLTYFKVYYNDNYVSKVDHSITNISSLNDILNNRNFVIDTITIDLNGKMHCLKNDEEVEAGYASIENRILIANGDFEKLIKKNPMIMLEACLYISDLPYKISQEYLTIMKNNYEYLKYESIEDIVKYIKNIMKTNNPLKGLNIIKSSLSDFTYNGIKIFDFVNYIFNKEDIVKLEKNDLLSRWSFLLHGMPDNIVKQTIDIFKLDEKKILWLINNFELPKSNNIKESIYNVSKTIELINDNKKMHNVFVLYKMINILSNIYIILDPDNKEKYEFMSNLICSRPFFNDQVLYEDSDIIKIVKKDINNIEKYKTELIKYILMLDKHPDDEEYIEVMKKIAEDF